jgi:hypothetical protein
MWPGVIDYSLFVLFIGLVIDSIPRPDLVPPATRLRPAFERIASARYSAHGVAGQPGIAALRILKGVSTQRVPGF